VDSICSEKRSFRVFDKSGGKSVEVMIEQPRFMIGDLGKLLAAASAQSQAEGAIQSKKIVVRNLDGSPDVLICLVTDSVGQQNRSCVFQLNQQIACSRPAFRQTDDIDSAEQASRIQPLLSFED